MEDAELADIQNFGSFRRGPNSLEAGKQFIDNLEDAIRFRESYGNLVNVNLTIVVGIAPQSTISASERMRISDIPGGLPTVLVPTPLLPTVRPIGPIP